MLQVREVPCEETDMLIIIVLRDAPQLQVAQGGNLADRLAEGIDVVAEAALGVALEH